VIVDPRFESFLYGRATSEQIRLLRSMGMSKKQLCNVFMVGEKRLKQCERTPGDFVYIQPMVWMAAPVLFLPKHVHFCIRNYYRKRMKIYNLIDVVHIYSEIYRTRERTGHINLNHVFGRSSGIKWWLSGRICSYDDVLKYEKSSEFMNESEAINKSLKELKLPKEIKNKKDFVRQIDQLNYHNTLTYMMLEKCPSKKEARKHGARLAD